MLANLATVNDQLCIETNYVICIPSPVLLVAMTRGWGTSHFDFYVKNPPRCVWEDVVIAFCFQLIQTLKQKDKRREMSVMWCGR